MGAQSLKSENPNDSVVATQGIDLNGNYISRSQFSKEMQALQDVLFNEIEFKLQSNSGAGRPSSKLRNEVSLGNSQYKKVLEIMLDLERKVDMKFLEQKQDTSTAIVTAYDPVR